MSVSTATTVSAPYVSFSHAASIFSLTASPVSNARHSTTSSHVRHPTAFYAPSTVSYAPSSLLSSASHASSLLISTTTTSRLSTNRRLSTSRSSINPHPLSQDRCSLDRQEAPHLQGTSFESQDLLKIVGEMRKDSFFTGIPDSTTPSTVCYWEKPSQQDDSQDCSSVRTELGSSTSEVDIFEPEDRCQQDDSFESEDRGSLPTDSGSLMYESNNSFKPQDLSQQDNPQHQWEEELTHLSQTPNPIPSAQPQPFLYPPPSPQLSLPTPLPSPPDPQGSLPRTRLFTPYLPPFHLNHEFHPSGASYDSQLPDSQPSSLRPSYTSQQSSYTSQPPKLSYAQRPKSTPKVSRQQLQAPYHSSLAPAGPIYLSQPPAPRANQDEFGSDKETEEVMNSILDGIGRMHVTMNKDNAGRWRIRRKGKG